jgi:hypothetical protein
MTDIVTSERVNGLFDTYSRVSNLVIVLGICGVTLVSTPNEMVLELLAGLGAAAPVVVSAIVILIAVAMGQANTWLDTRTSDTVSFIAGALCFAIAGAALGLSHDLFARVDLGAVFVRGPSVLEFAALCAAIVFVIVGGVLTAFLGEKARQTPELELTRRDQTLIASALPVYIGEGALLGLLVIARLLNWEAPGALHGVVLFLAGAAFIASVWFSVAIYWKLDEQERNLVYRQSTATFLAIFFLLAVWALGEAVGVAPALDAFAAFILLNAVYLIVCVPWTLWRERHELSGNEA